MGGVEMRKANEALRRLLQILLHEREQPEANDKNKHTLQSLEESNSADPTRELCRDDGLLQGRFFQSSFELLLPCSPPVVTVLAFYQAAIFFFCSESESLRLGVVSVVPFGSE